MKVLLCHNYYRLPGGEDQVYHDEGWLLERHGHEVIRFERHNDSFGSDSALKTAKRTIWNETTHDEIAGLRDQHRPDVVHFHNTFPLISPSAYYAARRASVPVIQTLHNFRVICPGSTLLRDDRVCQKCVGKTLAWPAIAHKCYRGSRAASAASALMTGWHRIKGTWDKQINRYIALTDHSKQQFIAGGLPAERVIVKPNFVRPDPGCRDSEGNHAVFVGRLSEEKGIDVLLEAWDRVSKDIELRIVGDGPCREQIEKAVQQNSRVRWLGQLPFEEVLSEIGRARCLICPSIWFETFGRSMIEAYATGTPVIASDIGSMKQIVRDGITGYHFQVGQAADLAAKVNSAFQDTKALETMGRNAREEFEREYTPERNYELLMNIYREAIDDVDESRSP